MTTQSVLRLPLGAITGSGGVKFRVFAPTAHSVIIEAGRAGAQPDRYEMYPQGDGIWTATLPDARAGWRYRYLVDGNGPFPDPYSRSQPDGVHGPSEVVDPAAYPWHDAGWKGLALRDLVVYECHIGTATEAGTFDALRSQLARIKRLGATAIEIMPVSSFQGRWGWGYDGAAHFAPHAPYGGPAGLKRLIDAAHQRGLAVLMDVVYNHLGPSGNYLGAYSPTYFTDRYQTPWGQALNYDGPESHWTREWAISNACYWLTEYHADGLRLDATHAIYDNSSRHLLAELTERTRAAAGRPVLLIAEDNQNDAGYLRPVRDGGFGFDAVWADDFHHAVHTALTGEQDGYYEDYPGILADIGACITQGFLYTGQRSHHLDRPRGTPTDGLAAERFVFAIQNHDQVGNRAMGDRLATLIGRPRYLAAAMILLLAPETPLIFQGDEWASERPFLYFSDHDPELGRLVTEGRRREFARFAAFTHAEARTRIPDPQAESTFRASILTAEDRRKGQQAEVFYRAALRLRTADDVLNHRDRSRITTAATAQTLLLRWSAPEGERLLAANFGPATTINPAEHNATKNLPDAGKVLLSTTQRRFGGSGATSRLRGHALTLPAESAVLYAFAPATKGAPNA